VVKFGCAFENSIRIEHFKKVLKQYNYQVLEADTQLQIVPQFE
jgi:hypothetical protein